MRETWNNLLDASDCKTVFLTWEWQFTWWESFGGALFIITVFEEEDLVGILPFVTSRKLGFDSLSFIGSPPHSDYLDFIIKRHYEEKVISFFVKSILAENCNIGIIHLDNINERSPNTQCIASAFPVSQYRTRKKQRLCYYLALPGSWQEYLSSLSGHRRYDLRRKARLIASDFDINWGMVSDGDDLQRRMGDLFDLHQKRMHQLNRYGVFSKTQAVCFHRRLSEHFLKKGYLRLYYLELDGKPVASLYMFGFNNIMHHYITGFDPDPAYYRYSPCDYLLGRSIEDAFGEGIEECDFLLGEGEYKSRWTKAQRANASFTIERRTPAVALHSILVRAGAFVSDHGLRALKERIPFHLRLRLRRCLPSWAIRLHGPIFRE